MAVSVVVGCPSESILEFHARRSLLRGHRLDRCLRKIGFPIDYAAIEEHLAEFCHIPSRRKKAAAGDGKAMGPVAERIGESARPRFHDQPHLIGSSLVKARVAGQLLFTRPECRIFHSERLKNPLVEKLLIRHSRDHLDDARRRIDSRAGIRFLGPRIEHQRRHGVAAHRRCKRQGIEREAVGRNSGNFCPFDW